MWQLFSLETLEGDFADFHAARCEGLCFDAIEKQRQLARGGAGSKDFAFDENIPATAHFDFDRSKVEDSCRRRGHSGQGLGMRILMPVGRS